MKGKSKYKGFVISSTKLLKDLFYSIYFYTMINNIDRPLHKLTCLLFMISDFSLVGEGDENLH